MVDLTQRPSALKLLGATEEEVRFERAFVVSAPGVHGGSSSPDRYFLELPAEPATLQQDLPKAVKVLAKLGPKGVGKKIEGKITDLYGAALDRFFVHQKKCILKREFFISAFKIMPEGLGGLRPKLTEYAANARNDFLKSKASELLKQLK